MRMDAVEEILGKPTKISNAGGGERWEYEGGGYVRFYAGVSGQVVLEFGGYSF